jgi:pyruvate dehydrogenase E2 component (dihydrolipoamide acetyltransferase)
MPTAISMPKLGMTMEEGTVVQWPLAPGDPVSKGELLLVIESEKTEVDIEAPESGVFRHIYVEEGDTVPCGSLLGAITATADEPFDAEAFHAAEDRPENKGGGALKVKLAPAATGTAGRTAAALERPVAPAARAAAKRLGLDPQDIPGTGPNGRVTRQDVESYAAAREALVPVADGVSLEVLSAGEGDPVLLLPGLGTDASAFARQTPVLAERFRVLGVNPRGVGLSDAPEADAYDVAQTAADAAATVEGAVHLIGASLGSAAALELALTQPERVRSLVLITPFVTASPRLVAIGEGWRRMAAEATAETLAAALLPWFFSSGFLADEAARGRTLRGLAQTVARVPSGTLDRMTAGMSSWSGSRADDLAKVSVPTLVVAAGEDLLTPGARAIAEAIPSAKLLVVEGAGHAVALECPETVNEAIVAHLA